MNPTPFIYLIAAGLMMAGFIQTGAAIYFGSNLVWCLYEMRKQPRLLRLKRRLLVWLCKIDMRRQA